jgi:hypothetical protein
MSKRPEMFEVFDTYLALIGCPRQNLLLAKLRIRFLYVVASEAAALSLDWRDITVMRSVYKDTVAGNCVRHQLRDPMTGMEQYYVLTYPPAFDDVWAWQQHEVLPEVRTHLFELRNKALCAATLAVLANIKKTDERKE